MCTLLTPALRPQVYIHLFTQEYERSVKNAKLRAVRAKARFGVCLAPQPKAGVNERQFVDGSIASPPAITPALGAAVRDGRFVYGPWRFCLLTPAFRLGFVMTTDWALALISARSSNH